MGRREWVGAVVLVAVVAAGIVVVKRDRERERARAAKEAEPSLRLIRLEKAPQGEEGKFYLCRYDEDAKGLPVLIQKHGGRFAGTLEDGVHVAEVPEDKSGGFLGAVTREPGIREAAAYKDVLGYAPAPAGQPRPRVLGRRLYWRCPKLGAARTHSELLFCASGGTSAARAAFEKHGGRYKGDRFRKVHVAEVEVARAEEFKRAVLNEPGMREAHYHNFGSVKPAAVGIEWQCGPVHPDEGR